MQALIVQSHFYLVMFYVAILVCFAPEWIGLLVLRPEAGAVKRDRGSHAIILVAISIGIVTTFSVVNAKLAGTTLTWHQPAQPRATASISSVLR